MDQHPTDDQELQEGADSHEGEGPIRHQVPWLTHALPGIGGVLKSVPEDFEVIEIPLYEPCGTGSHTYIRFRKRGIPTPVAVNRLAKGLGVHPKEVGVAGLKDAQAVTEQTVSIEHLDPRRVELFRDSAIEILQVSKHGNKLKTGHLKGNRFRIKVRQVHADALPRARAICEILLQRGVPNFFGEQRFGARGDSGRLGAALLAGDPKQFLDLYLGGPIATDPPECLRARQAYDSGNLEEALSLWPRHMRDPRVALSTLLKRPAAKAVDAVDKRMRRLFVSAFQSELFNAILARRIQEIDRVQVGDLAQKTDTGGVFLVEDEAAEQPRAAAFAISPTGPIVGERCRMAAGVPGAIETEVLASYGIQDPTALKRAGSVDLPGGRRALRYPAAELSVDSGSDEQGPYIEVSFIAPSGCYATVLLGEIMKG